MEENTPIKWAYPLKSNSTSADGASNETSNPELYFQALAQAKDGFYPMGASGLWHGGVHFDEGTAGTLEQSSVRCIADGEVIAYRIDEQYPKTHYSHSAGRGSRGIGKDFSTGFVLVKHKLQPPQPPAPAPASGTPAAPTPAPTLTFYSLYMHLLDWKGYQASDAAQPPLFMSEPIYSVKANKATSPLAGLRVREQANSNSTVLAILPKGCRIKLGDADTVHPNWCKLVSILEGCAIPALSGETERWVYANETEETGIADIRLVADRANDSEPTLGTPPKGLKIYKEGNASSKVIGLLPTGVKFSLEGDSGAYRKLKAITAGQDTAPLTANCVQNVLGYVLFEDLEVTDKTPPPFDEVQLLDPAIDIKAGDLIGHIGQYQNFEDELPRPMLHLQVFTCEALPAFISQCRELAKDLPNEQKTLAMVNVRSKMANPPAADAKVVAERNVRVCSDSPKEGCWAKVQQYVELKAKKAGFGSFDNAHNRYPMDAAKKTELANEFDLDVAELPDTVDFLLESYKDDGSDMYRGKNNIPATHALRKVGVLLKTPVWVEREKLSAAGQRASTSGELPAWQNFPLSNRLDGELCGYKRILPRAAWSSLDQQHKAIAPDNIRWWYVTVANAQGRDISGWVPEQDPILSLHSPWEWPGFSEVEDKQPLDAQLARQLNADGSLRGAEAERYLAQIDAAERGDILSSLYDIIDLPSQRGERDQKLSTEELKIALGKPWLAQQLSLLSAHFESEWYWSEAKWNALDSLMAPTPGQLNPNWESEKTRIKALSWWDKLADKHGINTDGKAWHFHPVGLVSNFLEQNNCIRLEKAQEIALLVTTGFEGASTLDYGALANNFDGQGMSFGIIQWNFGQGTLGPVLQDMRVENEAVFDACFGENMNYETLRTALDSGNHIDQKSWAVNIQATNNSGWKQSFEKIGGTPEFQKIQLKHAAKYHSNVKKCIRLMREISEELMRKVDLRTYVALYDLCVQQNNLEAARSTILSTHSTENITTQKQLLTFVCTKRALAANSIWVSDCLSRRLGIIQGATYTSTANGITKAKGNSNFNLIIEGTVCEL